MRAICVYCGSSPGRLPAFQAAARQLGAAIARRGCRLVYGGARVGLMGLLADAALAEGGEVVGVIPERLARKEIAHAGLTALHRVDSMHSRKALMADLADAFVALPGGLGTLEEMAETLVWGQIGIHAKPCGLLNIAGFYDPFLRFLEQMVEARFLRPAQFEQLLVSTDPEALLDALAAHRPAAMDKWLDEEGR